MIEYTRVFRVKFFIFPVYLKYLLIPSKAAWLGHSRCCLHEFTVKSEGAKLLKILQVRLSFSDFFLSQEEMPLSFEQENDISDLILGGTM